MRNPRKYLLKRNLWCLLNWLRFAIAGFCYRFTSWINLFYFIKFCENNSSVGSIQNKDPYFVPVKFYRMNQILLTYSHEWMNEALFNLGFDEVGKTFGKKLLISREKKQQQTKQKQIHFSGTIMGLQVSALRKLVRADKNPKKSMKLRIYM